MKVYIMTDLEGVSGAARCRGIATRAASSWAI